MDDLNSKLNVINKMIKQCEQSSLEVFEYQDAKFSICFHKSELNSTENVSGIADISKIDTQEKDDIITVVSPFVGTIEFSNQIKLGSNTISVKEGEVICSVEAMKIFNDIKSPVSGTIVEILVKDSKLVEYEQPILKIRVDKNE